MIGIGITTRNRPQVLETALKHFAKFPTQNSRIVIVDDNSDADLSPALVVEDFSQRNQDTEVIYRRSTTRLGIAKAKNACLAALLDCDHVFLFDDDAWPRVDGWAEQWVEVNTANGVGHSMWVVPIPGSPIPFDNPLAEVHPSDLSGLPSREPSFYLMYSWANCLGVMLYFNRQCLDAIGGYDARAENVYGYEHAQISSRASKAGFCKGNKYLSPAISEELIYSFDVSYNWKRQDSPIEAL